jgi:hypothetical protein
VLKNQFSPSILVSIKLTAAKFEAEMKRTAAEQKKRATNGGD